MSAPGLAYLCLALGLASALVGGVFQSFSDFVMRGLVESAHGGMAAMQAINRTVFRSAFMVTFLALVPASVVIAIYAGVRLDGAPRALLVSAALVYLSSVFAVTAAGNVPLNEQLERLAVDAPEAGRVWASYGRAWTAWNHVRVAGSVLTAALYLVAAISL